MPLITLDAAPTVYVVKGEWNAARTAVIFTVTMRGTVGGLPVYFPWSADVGATEDFDMSDAAYDDVLDAAITAAGYELPA